ncbi:hypothetical protein JDV02_006901 [Purpureocillium takamizusanense]|uniref:EamA domain-containing protein n=1 Tax=Purpureocillium takamizusanense TaxID=2060973 RepID=A0A9Q8VDI1_9HYPO|nr:uncharacterized protein JDV02_006901 [Purpureocillium takamizusanense]UNI20852.1 hypothetical protein JDV02_006901 [Purpureocillium takamizusanense]
MPRPTPDQEVHLLAHHHHHDDHDHDHDNNHDGDNGHRHPHHHDPRSRSPYDSSAAHTPQTDDDNTTCTPRQQPPDARADSNTAGGRGHRTSSPTAASGPEARSRYDGHYDDDPTSRQSPAESIELDDMDSANGSPGRPGLRRNGRSGQPLLYTKPEDEERRNGNAHHGRRSSDERATSLESGYAYDDTIHRPTLSRRSTMHSHNPHDVTAAEKATRKKYTFAAFFLAISLVSFCVQTELSAYIQHDLGWDKAYCMMYFTHGSWIVLYPVMLGVLRVQKLGEPWEVFRRRHVQMLKTTIAMIELQTLDVFGPSVQRRSRPFLYLARTTAFITSALTVAGLSWYIAVSLTTPSDLTAIYNCSAFFAYVFSVPILREPLRLDKSIAVSIAILGVLVVAYGDTGGGETDESAGPPGNTTPGAGSRFLGNLVIGVGSVLYGLYEVLYKRYACPPEGVSPGRGTIFANTFGACIGLFTLTVLWVPLPILHWLNIEKFELPEASTCWLILVAVLANATFSGSFLVLISLTSPVLSSVAALLTIFIVAIADWFLTGQPLSWAAIIGGSMIIVAFVGLSWSTYREMTEHEAQKLAVDLTDSDEDASLSPNDR